MHIHNLNRCGGLSRSAGAMPLTRLLGPHPTHHTPCFSLSPASACSRDAPCLRIATVEAHTKLVLLTLKRDTFTEILGPLEQLMAR